VVRWVLKKCLLLERNPEAGEELRDGPIGYWKLTVGDRDWSIVWRVTSDDTGLPVFDIAEVWAVGARSDSEVYTEMESRAATLSATPATVPLAESIARLGEVGRDLTPSSEEPEPDTQPALPGWLLHVLTTVVGMPRVEVDRLTEDQAQEGLARLHALTPLTHTAHHPRLGPPGRRSQATALRRSSTPLAAPAQPAPPAAAGRGRVGRRPIGVRTLSVLSVGEFWV
jgi:mRNA interferase RelE/StbE